MNARPGLSGFVAVTEQNLEHLPLVPLLSIGLLSDIYLARGFQALDW